MTRVFLHFLLGVQLLHLAMSLPTGAPENDQVCIEMEPLHQENEPQTSEAPYSLILSQDTYVPGDILQFTIEADEGTTFRGFTAQARRVTEEEEPIGTMLPLDDGFSQNVCETFAITHTNNTDKTSVTFEWQAPVASEGDLEVYFSVVQVFDTFWVRERSEPLFAGLSRGETLSSY